MPDAVLERTVFRLGRLIQTLPRTIVKPAMIAAPNPAIFDSAEFQRGPAVRTMKLQQSKTTAAVAKQNKIFAQQSHLDRIPSGSNLFRESDRPPITPQHVPCRRARPNPGQGFVFFFGQHGSSENQPTATGVMGSWGKPILQYSILTA